MTPLGFAAQLVTVRAIGTFLADRAPCPRPSSPPWLASSTSPTQRRVATPPEGRVTKTAETPDTKGVDMGEAPDVAHAGQQRLQASAEELARPGQPVPEQGRQHLSAILWEHIGLIGDVSSGMHLLGGSLRPLRMQEA